MYASDRINTTTEMVTARGTVADIGCDHCLALIGLLKSGKIAKGIGSDINKGPLEKAKKNIEANCLCGKIELRLGNGLTTIKEGEADAIIIAGMGGLTINGILNESAGVAKSASELILQPHNEVYEVRKNLHAAGFRITEEKMINERGKYYVTIKAAEGKERYESEAHYLFGKRLLEDKHSVLTYYLSDELIKNKRIINRLQKINSDNCELRITEINDMNKIIREVLECL